jgi:superfamily II DNA or RNA helicase
MTLQWQDELRAKFGLAFRVIDREFIATMQRQHGFGVNVWNTGAAFIVSHNLLIDESYAADLRAARSQSRTRSLLILDEAHHAAPSGGGRYATDSRFTTAIRELAPLFEHRLFLSATPHNGHSNSSPPSSRCWIRSASPAACLSSPATVTPSWCDA